MLFKVKNLGLIDEAEIKLDGITVITGENNVGKSTIGKMLYCVNNVFLKESIREWQTSRLSRAIVHHTADKTHLSIKKIDEVLQESDIISRIIEGKVAFLNKDASLIKLYTFFLEFFSGVKVTDFDELDQEMLDILAMDDKEIVNLLFETAKNTNFSGSTHNVYSEENEATEIKLKVDDSNIHIQIDMSEDISKFEYDPIILEEAIYIESSHVMRNNDGRSLESNFFLNFEPRQRLLQLLLEDESKDQWEKERVEKALGVIFEKISKMVPGRLVKQKYLNRLEYEEGSLKFDLINVSSGLKTLAVLKKLLVNAKLKRNGMLILDEPEIHLHPDWSTIFAEILILLQKQFNLKILINTHSGDFLMALEEYSKLHKIEDNCNYYLIKRNGYHSTCEDCTSSLNKIYQHFANFYDDLDNLRDDDDQ